MKIRTEHRYYTSPRGARFRSGEKELVLRANDFFKLFLDKKRPYLVKDGVVYYVKPKLLPELKARSEIVQPTKDYKNRETLLDTKGIDVADALNKHLTKTLLPSLTKYASGDVKHGVLNNRAFIEFPVRVNQGSLVVGFFMTTNVLGFAVYAPSTWELSGWDLMPLLQQQARKFAKYLSTKEGITTSTFKFVKSRVSNVRTPSGAPFSGTLYSYLTNWDTP